MGVKGRGQRKKERARKIEARWELLPFSHLKDCAFLSLLGHYDRVTGQLWKCFFEAEYRTFFLLPPAKRSLHLSFLTSAQTWLRLPLHLLPFLQSMKNGTAVVNGI